MQETYNVYEMITATLICYSMGYIMAGIGIALDELKAYIQRKREEKKKEVKKDV